MNLKIGNYASYLTVRELKEGEFVYRTDSESHWDEGILIDYDKDGKILGIEILKEVKPSYYKDYKER